MADRPALESTGNPLRFGLKTSLNGSETFLAQIGGSGRVRLCQPDVAGERLWWTKPPNVHWTVFEAPRQMWRQAFGTREAAERAADNLFKSGKIRSRGVFRDKRGE